MDRHHPIRVRLAAARCDDGPGGAGEHDRLRQDAVILNNAGAVVLGLGNTSLALIRRILNEIAREDTDMLLKLHTRSASSSVPVPPAGCAVPVEVVVQNAVGMYRDEMSGST
jgi:hypothetical protein